MKEAAVVPGGFQGSVERRGPEPKARIKRRKVARTRKIFYNQGVV